MSSYSPEEITVKTKNNRIVVHAKHEERPDEFGYIERELKRQYVLPKVKIKYEILYGMLFCYLFLEIDLLYIISDTLIHVYVLRKVGIGTILELSCAKWEFSLCCAK